LKKVAFHTLGCKVNQYETHAMMELFKNADYDIVTDKDFADVYVINTCTVTNVGDRKSRQFIRKMKNLNPKAVVAVVGCYAQVAPEEVENLEGVDIVIGTHGRKEIVRLVENKDEDRGGQFVGDIMQVYEFEDLSLTEYEGKTRAFIKIQEGCNQYCTYCIIPYARGNIRSRNKDLVLEEVNRLAKAGYKEVVLTGIHIASYGKDLQETDYFLELLRAINKIPGILRIRLSSLEPNLINEAFLQKLQAVDKLCPHFHLSLQSGSDSVLKRMNRKYTGEEYRQAIFLIRQYFDNPALTTDVIVGFPGETDEDFEDTYDLVEALGFSEIHVFKYSPKKGTPAAKYNDQINGTIKQQRSEKLIALGERLKKEYMASFIGAEEKVLFESFDPEEKVSTGFTTRYVKVKGAANRNLPEEIQSVKILKITEEKKEFFAECRIG
jgi:threonylcarbamoyladenosine tRNA methylthiotransferase MtaB